MGSEQKSYGRTRPGPCALWPVDLKLSHLDWNPEATLIHFQGQYLTICELDYKILQGEIQNSPKSQVVVDIGDFCLVEDLTSARWYRGRVQNQKNDLYDVFLIDYGNILSVDQAHISSCSSDLFLLPPKIVCGFLSSVLVLPGCCHTVVEQYFAKLIGRNVTGYIQAFLPHKVLLLEAPDINSDLVRHGFGRRVDTDTYLLLVEMLTETPLKLNIEPAPDLLIERQRGQEHFLKPTSIQGYEDILSSCRPKLKSGSHVTVRVTAAVNSGLFYCQMADKESELKELSSKLAAVCEIKVNKNQLKTTDNLSLLCSVKGKDDKWYRGLVQDLPVNSFVRVLFVDYGYFESVKIENILKLPPNFCSLPIMCFPCALTSLDNEDDDIKSKQLTFLKKGLLGETLDIEINKYKPEQHLYYITILQAQNSPYNNLARSESEKQQNIPQSGNMYYETILRKELDKTIEDEKIKVGSVFAGYVEYIQNPNQFWIRSEKRNKEFEEMMEKLSGHFRRIALDEDILEKPEPGMLCCAVYEEDMHYYRGVVMDLLEHGAEVLFIDFGNFGKVPFNLIKKIPEGFARKSAFALCCSLVNVVPTDEFWTSSSTDSFRCLSSNKILQVTVIQMRKNKFDVDLCYDKRCNDGGKCLSELLISANQANYRKNISKQFFGEKVNHGPSKQKVTKHNKQPLLNSKASDDWNDQEEASKDETDNPKEPVSIKAFKITPGCEFTVCCPLINTPSDFWCQRLNKVAELEALMARLQEHYSTKTVPLQPESLCCVVKSPNSQKWCRGIITTRQKGQAKVILADFGSSVQVSEEYLQGLLPEFWALEGQAFRCSLYNLIEPLLLGWTGESTEFLRKFVDNSGKNLKCSVVSQLNVKNKSSFNVVELCNTVSKQSVSNLLVENSLAQVVTRTLSPTVFPESFVYSSYGLTKGSEEQVFVTHVNSHCEVFCQLKRNMAVIGELDSKISEVQKVVQANVEKLCLVKYLDGEWYRGIAYSAQSPSHVCVTFVDYGNTMIAEKKHVVSIPKESMELLNKPMQAMRFSLAGVPRGLISADVKDWLDTAVLNKLVKAVIVAKLEDGSFEVELLDGEVIVNDRLKELIHSLTPQPKITATFNIISKKIKQNAKGTSKGQLKAKTFATSYIQKKSNTSCQNKHKERVKSLQSKKQEIRKTAKKIDWPSPPEPRTTSAMQHKKKQSVAFQISCLPTIILTKGSKLECFATHINSLSRFFLQRENNQANLLQLLDTLNSSVFRETLEPYTNIPPNVDDLVLAEYKEDGSLYRAVVKEKVDSCTFHIEFVDFGNSAIVGKEKMFLMPKDIISQPRHCIPCSLLDCKAFDSSAAFKDAVMDKSLMVEFVGYKKCQWEVKVEILDTTISVPVTKGSDTVEPATPLEVQVPMEINTTPKEANTDPEVERLTQIKLKTRTCAWNRGEKCPPKKSTSKVSEDLFTAFFPPKIQSGDTGTGLVLAVQSNSDFYVRLNKSNYSLAALETLIAINLKNYQPILTNYLNKGLNCLVQEQNGGPWRRAVVKDISHNDCLVHLLDHGKTETVLKSALRIMPSGLVMIPPYAVCCRLNIQGRSEQDGQIYYQALKAIEGNEAKLIFMHISEKTQMWFVEMVMDELLLKHVSNTVKQTELCSVQEKGSGLDSAQTDESEPDGNLPQKLAFASVELNKEYWGFAAAVTTPFEFCVILEDLHLMSEVSILLDDLQDELQPLPLAHLASRTGCLVRSESRNKWSRAEILRADTTLTLNLVDYGHDEVLSYGDYSKLKKLPDCIRELPKLTYPCILNTVRPLGVHEQWTPEAATFFQQCLDQRNLQIFFREEISDCLWKVDVLANEVHVAKQLVDAGHAIYTDIMLGLRSQGQRLKSSPRHRSDEECDEGPEECDEGPEECDEGPEECDEGPEECDEGPEECDEGPEECDEGPEEGVWTFADVEPDSNLCTMM